MHQWHRKDRCPTGRGSSWRSFGQTSVRIWRGDVSRLPWGPLRFAHNCPRPLPTSCAAIRARPTLNGLAVVAVQFARWGLRPTPATRRLSRRNSVTPSLPSPATRRRWVSWRRQFSIVGPDPAHQGFSVQTSPVESRGEDRMEDHRSLRLQHQRGIHLSGHEGDHDQYWSAVSASIRSVFQRIRLRSGRPIASRTVRRQDS